MKNIFFISTFMILFSACQKKPTNFLTVKGRVVDATNNQIVSNFQVQINYLHPNNSMGPNLVNWNNITNCKTDMNGNFIVTTPHALAKDTDDFYEIQAFGSDSYFGFSKTIDARKAESQKNINLGDVKVDKIITLNLTIHHSGANNNEDFIIGDVDHTSLLVYGSDSVIKKKYSITYNKPCIINWTTRKNNVTSVPFSDTLIYTNLSNHYSITY